MVFSMDAKETLVESDAEEVDPLITHEEGVNSPYNGMEESLNSISIDSKESGKFFGVEDVKTGLESIFLSN